MTPTLLALSRAFGAIPGAPTAKHSNHSLYSGEGLTYFRDGAGIRWVDAAGPDLDDYEWLLDLTDAATGGVMLDRFARVGGFGVAFDPSVAVGRWLAGDWFDLVHEGATLAEAVARAAVALGRAS